MTTPETVATTEKPTIVGVGSAVTSNAISALVTRADVIQSKLAGAYSLVRQGTKDRESVNQLLTSARQAYDEGRAKILRENADDIKKLGSNEELREAKIRGLLTNQFDLVSGYTRTLTDLDHQLKLANLDLQEAKDDLRVLEVIGNLVSL